jgi:hypothetical protein
MTTLRKGSIPMPFPHFGRQPRPPVATAARATAVGPCPRLWSRARNPALPPPGPCLTRGPDCCAASAAVAVRRVA